MDVADFLKRDLSRRQFLGKSAQNAAGVAAGMVGLSGAVAQASPGERVRLGVIGVRNQGKKLAASLAGFADVDISTVCDVDQDVFPKAMQSIETAQGFAAKTETDFRRVLDDNSIDGVVIATPDHWHAVMTILACQAGKDVYVEKPVSHNIAEGRAMIAVAADNDRIVQSGLQQRSGSHFQSAIEYVASGKLGNVNLAKAWTVHRRKPVGVKKNERAPKRVDYELWLGPAAQSEFNPNRFHYNWRWFWDFGTGELGNWGVHMLDIARWGLNVELPTRISASGGKYSFRDDQETPDTLVAQYEFANVDGVNTTETNSKTIVWEHRQWSNHGIEGRSAAAAFYGENGTLIVDRGGWKVYDQKQPTTSNSSELAQTHQRNFVDCIKTRQTPTADLEIGHISSTLCHLGNIAFKLGREVRFDPESENFDADTEANALLSREYRKPWTIEV